MSQCVKFKKHRAICAQSREKRAPNKIKYSHRDNAANEKRMI